jgi:pyrroline-5-carboxylate reductase
MGGKRCGYGAHRSGRDWKTAPMGTVAILGAGVMGETLLSGLIRSGRSADDLVVTARRPDRADDLAQRYGVRAMSNIEAAEAADTLVLVVKPQDMGGLVEEIRDHVSPGNLVVSLAAGIPTKYLESRLPEGVAVVRVMPNTPALVDQGMAAVSPGRSADAAHLEEAAELLRSCGRVVQVAEKHQDAVTAISGSGPAYIFYVVEAMIEAGVVLGLPRPTATELVVQTLFGAATMMRETGQHPTVLREQVTSPGGTTAAALRQLDDHKVRAAFITAMEAAANRSHELASGND